MAPCGVGVEVGWTELTALAVVSVQLYDKDGRPVQVTDPVQVSVPLPADTANRMATSVPSWTYRPSTGTPTPPGPAQVPPTEEGYQEG